MLLHTVLFRSFLNKRIIHPGLSNTAVSQIVIDRRCDY